MVLAVQAAVLILVLLRGRGGSDTSVRGELRSGREESARSARELREEVARGLKSNHETLATTMRDMGGFQKTQLEGVAGELKNLTDTNQKRLDALRDKIDERLGLMQRSNEAKLDDMRNTVDEKLQSTLEKRLGESFKLVSERLEAVQQGLGEMKTLASGVDDLRRVLTNVKSRGTWAEYQLGALLEQILTPAQYDRNVKMRVDTAESVEFAIKLPGPDGDPKSPVWLPIDSKFPQEDYLRLLEAADRADGDAVQKAAEALARAAMAQAKSIREKYVNPPTTTDFAIMFLATEGLYAEILRQPGLVERLHNDSRVVVAGPATISAILSSLRLGFRTLAIEERASEVWRVLAAVKTEFGKFGGVLERVKRHLDSATKTIDETGVRTRVMERKLRDVEQLPADAASKVLGLRGKILPEPSEGTANAADGFGGEDAPSPGRTEDASPPGQTKDSPSPAHADDDTDDTPVKHGPGLFDGP
jgi:DNA recombination protein RmuC